MIFVTPSIASNFAITLLIISLNNILYRTTRLINPISSDFLEDPNAFLSRIYIFLILRASERIWDTGNFLSDAWCPLFPDSRWLFCVNDSSAITKGVSVPALMTQGGVTPWGTLTVKGIYLCQGRSSSGVKPMRSLRGRTIWSMRQEKIRQKWGQRSMGGWMGVPPTSKNLWHHFTAGSTTVRVCDDAISEMRLPKRVCISDICQQPYLLGLWSCTWQHATFCIGRL